MPCCILRHSETKDFVPFLGATEEDGEGRNGTERRERDSWGTAVKVLEMNFCPNRIMFIFSAVPYHYSLSSLDLHEVENCCDLFFQEIMFFKVSFAEF